MSEAPQMIVTDDGVRVRLEDAKRFGIDTTTVVAGGTGELRRTTTAAAVPVVVKNDATGTVITSAADASGADDGQVPVGTNEGLGEATTTPVEAPAATATTETTEGTTDGAGSDQPAGSGDGNKPARGRSKAAAGS